MSSNQDPFIRALERIEQHIERNTEDGTSHSAALESHRAGVQFAFFALVSAIKLSPGFDATLLRQFAQTALDHPPPGFEGDVVFREPLDLLMTLTTDEPAE